MNAERSVIDFKEIFSLIFRKLWLIILFAICGGVIAFCISKYLITPKYEAHMNLYVQSDYASAASDNKGDVNNLKQLTNTYIEVLNDDFVMEEMSNELVREFGEEKIRKCFNMDSDGNILPEELRKTIFIESVPDTLVLKLKVISKDPEISVGICNYFAVYSDIYLKKAISSEFKAQFMTWAKYNDVPVSPNMAKNTALGIVTAVLLSLLLIFILDFFDDSVRDVNVLGNRYDMDVIGEVAHFKSTPVKRVKKTGFVSLLDRHVPFTAIENYKAIRTSIIYALSNTEKKVISVSSAEPFEGKSVSAANIAITLAQGGNKVLLIDADLRNPVQHKIFRLGENKGLANALTDITELNSCIKKTFMEKLDILPAGPAISNASDLVASDNMDRLIEKLEQKYTYIIIDTPAVNYFTDSVEIAKKVSGMVMVVKYNETKLSDMDLAIRRIEFFEANVLGFILNDKKNNKKYNKFREPSRDIQVIKKTDAQIMNKNASHK